ncbi:MAG: hypothetical protein KA173_06060 [Rhodoferax sp.]|nr:hypothetical protein [Rhodoferax sp.]MBP7492322.1 hypothetical protein [Rhodoferax sp.]
MTWTTPADLRLQVQKLWDKGDLLRPLVQGDAMPAKRLRLVGPTSSELTERFDAVRAWMADLRQVTRTPGSAAPKAGYRITLREFRHRVLGHSAVPDEVWLDTLEDAWALIGKAQDARRFNVLLQLTREQYPALLSALSPWLEKRPLTALALADEWARLLAVVVWLQSHPRPGLYLRQVDLGGVDSKFFEAHRGVLAELLDLSLPAESIDPSASGLSGFCRRYGFKDKPLRIRFRVLDPAVSLLPQAAAQDITLTQADFEALNPPVRDVFITENEVNFLAFPPVAHSLVIFGAGYGFEVLAGAPWLQNCRIHYWGDLDTHGFAILDQLRAHLPHVQSLLMDHATLMAHAAQWGTEPQPVLRDLPRLTAEESAVYNDLRDNRLRPNLRLEQERIGFGRLQQALAALPL